MAYLQPGESPEGNDPLISSSELQIVSALAKHVRAVRKKLDRLSNLESPAAFLHEGQLVLMDGGLEMPSATARASHFAAENKCRMDGFALPSKDRYTAFRSHRPAADAASRVWTSEAFDRGFATYGCTRKGEVSFGTALPSQTFQGRGYRRAWSTQIAESDVSVLEEILERFREMPAK